MWVFTDISINNVKVPTLLDSGSVFNMLRSDVVKAAWAKVVLKEGSVTTGWIENRLVRHQLTSSSETNDRKKIQFTVVDEHSLQAIIVNPILRESIVFGANSWTWWVDEVRLWTTEHPQILQSLVLTSPCRKIEYQYIMVNPVVFQEPQRHLNDMKTKYLLKWIPSEMTDDLIEEEEVGDFLSLIVPHCDKAKIPIPSEDRVCIDASRVNRAFAKIPIAMLMISDIVNDLSRYPLEVGIDMKWVFNHMALTIDLRKLFGFPSTLGKKNPQDKNAYCWKNKNRSEKARIMQDYYSHDPEIGRVIAPQRNGPTTKTTRQPQQPISRPTFKRAPFGFINSLKNQQFIMTKRIDRRFRIG